jgi:hypothetical protein
MEELALLLNCIIVDTNSIFSYVDFSGLEIVFVLKDTFHIEGPIGLFQFMYVTAFEIVNKSDYVTVKKVKLFLYYSIQLFRNSSERVRSSA